MKNEIWEKVLTFLMDLRCSEMQRKSRIDLESCVAEKKKLEILQKEYTRIKEVLSEKDRMALQEYVEQLKQVSFEEQQEAYCQHYEGYIITLSTRKLYDEGGQVHYCVDETLRRRLETKLITKILDFEVA